MKSYSVNTNLELLPLLLHNARTECTSIIFDHFSYIFFQERKWPPPTVKRPTKGRGAGLTRDRSLDLQDRQRQEARRRLMAAKRAASFRQSSVSERADSIEIYIPEAQTRLWNARLLILSPARAAITPPVYTGSPQAPLITLEHIPELSKCMCNLGHVSPLIREASSIYKCSVWFSPNLCSLYSTLLPKCAIILYLHLNAQRRKSRLQ